MKLFVSYNVFDGVELLESAIKSIREAVDYVHINYQMYSNHDEWISDEDLEILVNLLNSDLVDGYSCYEPNFDLNPSLNEFLKRNSALNYAKQLDKGFTHFLSLDADEYYKLDEFIEAKKIIEENNYVTTACHVQGYQRLPIWQDNGLWINFVPFIFKITDTTRFDYGSRSFPVIVDPTRITTPLDNFRLFKPEEIVMHHMTIVRKDLHKKYKNSSSTNDGNKHNVNDIVRSLKNVQPNDVNKIRIVDNVFNIPYESWNLE